jgi:hypothetical protein
MGVSLLLDAVGVWGASEDMVFHDLNQCVVMDFAPESVRTEPQVSRDSCRVRIGSAPLW